MSCFLWTSFDNHYCIKIKKYSRWIVQIVSLKTLMEYLPFRRSLRLLNCLEIVLVIDKTNWKCKFSFHKQECYEIMSTYISLNVHFSLFLGISKIRRRSATKQRTNRSSRSTFESRIDLDSISSPISLRPSPFKFS